MSVPRHDTIRGKLLYNGREYRVLNAPLPDAFINRYNALEPERRQAYSTAPWNNHKLTWVLKKDGLYLTEMFRDDLLPYMFDRHELKANWVDHLDIHIATEIPLSSEEDFFKKERLYFLRLEFEQATFRSASRLCSSSYGIQMRRIVNYLSRQTGIYTFQSNLLTFDRGMIRLKSAARQKDFFEDDFNEMLRSTVETRKQFAECLKKIQTQNKRVLYFCNEVSLSGTRDIGHIAGEISEQIVTVTGGSFSSFLVHLADDEGRFLSTAGSHALKKHLEMMLEAKEKKFFDLSQPYDSVTVTDSHTPGTVIVKIMVGYDTVHACKN